MGKRVGVQAFRVCGDCSFCRSGRENLCRTMIHIGHAQGWEAMDYFPGAYAEYCLGWADLLHPIPEQITFAEAAMADILCVAVHAVARTQLREGATVLCIGGGPVGLAIAQVARARGAQTIFLSDPSPLARRVLSQYEEFVVIDPARQSVPEAIAGQLGDRKCAAIFDSVGTAEVIGMGLPLLQESGTYVNMAVHGMQLIFDALALGSERTLTTSSNAHYRDLSEAFELLDSGSVDVKPWITHRLPLEEHQQAFELLSQSPKAAYKVVFEPWGRLTGGQ